MNSRKSLVSLRESASSVEDAASSAGLESGGSNSRPLRKRPRLSKRASMAEDVEEVKTMCDNLPQLGKEFDVLSKIGEGTFSSVYLARHKSDPDSELVAIKNLVPTSSCTRIENEIYCLQNMGGTNHVISMLGFLRNQCHVALILPYFKHEKFTDYFSLMSVAEIRGYLRALCEALKNVHSHRIIHRDVKPSNFLYNRAAQRYQLVDFGLAHLETQSKDEKGSIPSIMTRAQPSTGSRKQSTASGSRSDVVTQQNQGGCGHYRVGHSNNQEKRGHHHEGSGHHHQDGCGHHQEGHGHHHKKGCGHQHQEGHAHRHQEGRGHHQEVRGHNQAGRSHQMGRDHHQMGRGHHQIGHGKCHQEGRAHNQDGRGSVDSKARDIVVICPVRHEVDEVCERCMTRPNQIAPRAGTPGFRAPEVLIKYPRQTTAVDIWSAGVILLCLLSRRYPFFRAHDDMSAMAQIVGLFGSVKCAEAAHSLGKTLFTKAVIPAMDLKTLCECYRMNVPRDSHHDLRNPRKRARTSSCSPQQGDSDLLVPESAYQLMYRCLDLNPQTRITAAEALKHDFLTER